ncbi:MAG: DUF3095 domain-containing protein [Pseudomonadota bacterium]
MSSTEAFYDTIPLQRDFATLSDAHIYTPLPNDWWVATSDTIGSTQAVADGQYKTVNLVGAAVISAQINAHQGKPFPFIFGGDGAGFAVPPAWKDRTEEALLAVKAWAQTEFGLGLRVGMMPILDIRTAGLDVTVARFQAAEGVDYAMFSGGGMSWAKAQMKAGAQVSTNTPPDIMPDLTGLSCRWSNMPSQHGVILSMVILPSNGVPSQVFSNFAQNVLRIASRLPRAGHPAQAEGPGVRWPPAGTVLEAHAQRGSGSFGASKRKVLLESFIAWLLIKTGLKIGGFDARRYRRIVGDNADFRKFEDGLKMTLDCDANTEKQIRDLLAQGAKDGVIHFGLHTQSEAMMTCIVPSILSDNHVHFVDGASGGYTAAAQSIKHRLASLD